MGFKLTVSKTDIENALGGNFEPIPAGVYGSTITEAVVKDSKAGNPMYVVKHLITGGATGIGRKITSYHVIQGKGAFSSTQLLKALELPYIRKDMTEAELEDYEYPDPEDLIGNDLNVKIVTEPYTGMDPETGEPETRYRNNIAGTYVHDEDRFTELEDEDDSSSSGGLLG